MRFLSFRNSLLLIFVMVLSLVYIPSSTGEALLPKIEDNEATPIIDGNITAIEWENDVQFNTSIAGLDAQVRVTSNSSFLFIGFNYTTPNFIQVNSTLFNSTLYNSPSFNATSFNATQLVNNGTHDWIALQFDNNLDQQPIGTEASPDDAIVVDQYNNASYDGFIAGNVTNPFVQDLANNGTDSGTGVIDYVLANQTIDDMQNVAYEFIKPINGDDELGYDLNLDQTKILQFKFLAWFNQTSANSTTESSTTEWFTLRVNLNGSGVALKSPAETTISLFLSDDSGDDYQAVSTVLSSYGYQVQENRNGQFAIGDSDLQIIVLGDGASFPTNATDSLREYLRLGGKALIFLSDDDLPASNTIASSLGLSFLANDAIIPGPETNTTESLLEINSFSSELPFMSGVSNATDTELDSLQISTNALNISGANNASEMRYIFSQEYQLYNLFDGPTGLVYDGNGDGVIDDDEDFTDLSLGVSIDLLKGGRVTVLPSNSLVSNELFTNVDNIEFLLRLIPWNARLTNTIEIQSAEIDTHQVIPGNTITITVKVTDEFGEVIDASKGLVLVAEFLLAQNVQSRVQLELVGDFYVGELVITRRGSLTIETTAFLTGSGFSEGNQLNLVSEGVVAPFNNLDNVSTVLATLFVISVGLAVIVWIKTKDFEL